MKGGDSTLGVSSAGSRLALGELPQGCRAFARHCGEELETVFLWLEQEEHDENLTLWPGKKKVGPKLKRNSSMKTDDKLMSPIKRDGY